MSNQEQLELERIKASVMEYVEGVVEWDLEKGLHPWHPDGLKISYDSEKRELVRKTILQTKPDLTPEDIEQVKTKLSESGTILSVDTTGNTAFVKLAWLSKTATTLRETIDYILLLKIEDEWKIVSKVFHINDLEVES